MGTGHSSPETLRARLRIFWRAKRLAGCGKTQSAEEQRPLGLKPTMISRGLRGPEGPLFHGDPHIREFFRSL